MIVYTETATLERDLGIPAKTLFAVSHDLKRHYRRVELPKADGSVRVLSVPDPVLKKIQRSISANLLAYMPVSPWATAYRPGGGVRRNALPHCGQEQLLKLDIRRFFDSVRYTQVKETVFPAAIYAEKLRVLLSILCYYKEGLPQGAPTSPAIANILLRRFDETVGGWCGAHGVAYTRYCDDLAFSGSFDPAALAALVREALRREGFSLNGQKTRLAGPGRRQLVTGAVVNLRPRAPAEDRRALRQELYYCQKFGVRSHLEHTRDPRPPQAYLAALLGRLDFALSLSPEPQLAQGRRWVLDRLRQERAFHP